MIAYIPNHTCTQENSVTVSVYHLIPNKCTFVSQFIMDYIH